MATEVEKGIITLYYGNKVKSFKPTFGAGDHNNDYWSGFYTTMKKELAKEWAWSSYTSGEVGYLHVYDFDRSGLSVLNLTNCDSVHWLAELFAYRLPSGGNPVLSARREAFLEAFKLDTSKYDVIIGYRADDSFFAYARDFLNGSMSKSTVEKVLRHGNLGLQVFIKSELAFSRLKEVDVLPVNKKYRNLFVKRDNKARADYKYSLQEVRKNLFSGDYIMDILREVNKHE